MIANSKDTQKDSTGEIFLNKTTLLAVFAPNPHQFYNQRVNTLRVSHYFQYTRPDFSQHSTPRYTVYHATRRQARSSCRRTSSEFRRNSSRRFVPEYESTSGSVAAVMGPFLSSRVTQPSSTSEQSGHDTYFVGGLQSKSSAD